MALRIRRGTEAQLQLITPVEGELIYTTDSKDLYVGDGTTVGGVKVGGDIPTSINDLTDVNLSGISVGQVLKWNGSSFVPGDDDTVVGTSEGVIEGSNYRINIAADDSTILVDVNSKQINGLVVGNIYDDFSDTVVINPISRLSKLDIVSDSDVLILSHNSVDLYNSAGSQLIDGENKVFYGDLDGNVRGSLINQSLTKILVNHITETLQGTLIGDVVGSVFGDDSTLIIDAVNNTISVNLANINLLSYTDTGSGFDGIRVVASDQNEAELRLNRKNILPNGSQESVGVLYFDTLGTDGFESTTAYIQSFGSEDPSDNYAKTFLELSVIDENGNVTQDNSLVLTWDGKTGFGTSNPTQKLDVRGNGIFSGEVQAAAFKGSLMADDSTTLVDATNGVITAQHIQFGSYSSVQRPSGINGMVIYNSTVNRFQGFQNGSWINLDDGTAA